MEIVGFHLHYLNKKQTKNFTVNNTSCLYNNMIRRKVSYFCELSILKYRNLRDFWIPD